MCAGVLVVLCSGGKKSFSPPPPPTLLESTLPYCVYSTSSHSKRDVTHWALLVFFIKWTQKFNIQQYIYYCLYNNTLYKNTTKTTIKQPKKVWRVDSK